MSISGALANALSGLTAASRAAQIVGSNVSNATTDGYARREIELSARANTGSSAGVQIDGIRRIIDETLVRDRQLADASVGFTESANEFDRAILQLVGTPDQSGSLSDLVASFEASLLEATSRPDSEARLTSVISAAGDLTTGINRVSDGIQKLREDADSQITQEITLLNDTLKQIADVNSQILRAAGSSADLPGLLDQRQALTDRIAQVIPIRTIPQENGTIALYSTNGALLLDAKAAIFEFQQTAPITADMTLVSGALSGLQINGQDIPLNSERSPIAGGSLASLFAQRDIQAVEAQGELDALSRNLIERFEDVAVDPTLSPGDAGIFTDGGGPLDLADLTGLSSRITLNSLIDPSAGSEAWRLRDGLGAASPGSAGNATVLTALSDAMSTPRALTVGAFSGASKSFSGLMSDFVSQSSQRLNSSDSRMAFEQSRRDALKDAELAQGVDTDQEMQKLLLIEQAYSANARVIQTADRLLQRLLDI